MSAETAAPQRNFTVPAEERVRALVGGPPAYLRRLRAIEDLEQAIARRLTQGADGAASARRDLARLNALIERHNCFYPIEAYLPICVRTGQLLDRTGVPWRPYPTRSLDDFLRGDAR